MALRAVLQGPIALVSLGASYIARRPIHVVAGAFAALPVPLALAVAPVLVMWSAALAGRAVASAIRIGWRVRAAPVLEPRHELVVGLDELAPVCSLISDTHVTAGGGVPCELDEDPGQWPFRDVPATDHLVAGVRALLASIHRDAPRTVIWCGDEVDSGCATEWAGWRAAVDAVPGLAHRLVPGNHDICFNRPFDEDHALARRAQRERAYQAHGDRLADYPVVDAIVGDNSGATLLLLDSCKHRSTHILSNAIGCFGDVQLAEVERILTALTGPVLCVSHHHVWRDAAFLQPDEWYNTTVDADQLARVLLAYRKRDPANHVLVCHGHRHAMAAGSISDGEASIDVVGLPSSTLGDKSIGGILDGVLRYVVAGLRRDGSWGVALVAVGSLVEGHRGARPAPRSVPSAGLRTLSPIGGAARW